MKFCENVSILNTKPIKFSATTPIPFSKKYRQEGHKRIERHSVPESVKQKQISYSIIQYIVFCASFKHKNGSKRQTNHCPLLIRRFVGFLGEEHCNLKDTDENSIWQERNLFFQRVCNYPYAEMAWNYNSDLISNSALLEKYMNSYCPQFPSRTA